MSLEDALLNVWRQSLVENKKTVTLEEESFPVRSTAKRKLKQIDFQFDGKDLRGPEQNPEDRKSTRLNSSHGYISYAVFCLKKKKNSRLAPLGVKPFYSHTHPMHS